MYTLFKKEISEFFSSLIGYIVIGIFLTINGLVIWGVSSNFNVLTGGYASLETLFFISPIVFLLLVPAITMRMFADERKTGTIELLYTKPISDFNIILSKYLAGLTIVVFSLLPTLLYFLSIYLLGNPVGSIDTGGTWGSYIGLFFLAAVYVAIGIFASSLTKNQIIAFLISVILCYLLYIGFDTLSGILIFSSFEGFILSLGIMDHYVSISRGVIDSRDILYFLSVIAFFIVLTKFVLQSRKW